jgi:ribosome recycling factor
MRAPLPFRVMTPGDVRVTVDAGHVDVDLLNLPPMTPERRAEVIAEVTAATNAAIQAVLDSRRPAPRAIRPVEVE